MPDGSTMRRDTGWTVHHTSSRSSFNCTLMAPHGGIFVFPVVGNPLMYLAALAVGTVVGALMLGVLKKKIAE